MLFNSFSFLVFFSVVTTLYFAIPYRFRTLLLLIASCVFYMAFVPYYILILLATILVDYYAGIKIEENRGDRKKLYLILSIISTCAVLGIFKYSNFFISNFDTIARMIHWNYSVSLLSIILPIGLSFHTFQSLSYVVEVYRGNQKAEKNFLTYSLYVMFYPQLVAGPIERPQNLLHQFYEKHDFDYSRITRGLQRMLWGFVKKIVVAGNMAFYVNKVYDKPFLYHGVTFLVATLFFAIEIYCDFSGYSDIAIGSAEVMGFRLMRNFKNPYFSLSIPEFWSRWHISLSTWFKDYVYIPLGGNREGKIKWIRNIMITFLLSGFWHGANWTFVIWGAIHGTYTVLSSYIEKGFQRVVQSNRFLLMQWGIKWMITFFLVLFAWIFFRARNVSEGIYIAKGFLNGIGSIVKGLFLLLTTLHTTYVAQLLKDAMAPLPSFVYLAAFFGVVGALMSIEYIDYQSDIIEVFRSRPTWLRWCIYILAILAIMNLGVTKSVPFIYFQF